MSAQPIEYHDPRDPDVIVATLPELMREVFLADYRPAAHAAAADVREYPALRRLLQQWSVRAAAYRDPAFWEERRAVAQAVAGDGVALGDLLGERGLSR